HIGYVVFYKNRFVFFMRNLSDSFVWFVWFVVNYSSSSCINPCNLITLTINAFFLCFYRLFAPFPFLYKAK
ncbi:hypothetical protein, partial [Treponema sp. R6D11]